MEEQDITNLIDSFIVIFVIIFILSLYFLPTIIAFIKKHSHKFAILTLNLIMGLSGVGWIAAFIWAFIEDKNK